MAVYAYTSAAQTLLDHFKAQVAANKIREWRISPEGYWMHTAGGWDKKVCLRPVVTEKALKLNVVYFVGVNGTREMFGVISGRITEMLIAHCDKHLTSVASSKDAMDGDAKFT